MRIIVVFAFIIFFSNCQANKIKLRKVEDINLHKKELNVKMFKQFDFNLNCLMDYRNCGIVWHPEMIKKRRSYIVTFIDSTTTQFEILEFNSRKDAENLVNQLKDMVYAARNLLRNDRLFCVHDYHYRIYNYVLKNNLLYLFTLDTALPFFKDAHNSVLSSGRLKSLDAVCEALR